MSKSRFAEACPRRLKNLPTDGPCPLALQSIEAWQNEERDETKLACSFFSFQSQHSYCFFSAIDDQNGYPIESDREIAKTLGLTEKEVKSATNSAVAKLKKLAKEGDEDVGLWLECLSDVNRLPPEADIYAGEQWFFEGDQPLVDLLTHKGEIERLLAEGKLKEDVAAALLKRGPGRPSASIGNIKGFAPGYALHKSGKRVQLHSLSGNWVKIVEAFQKGPTPIRMSTNTLVDKSRKLTKEEKEESKTDEKK